MRNIEESSQDYCLPFFPDDDASGAEGSPSFLRRRTSMKSNYGFSVDSKVDVRQAKSNPLNNKDLTSRDGSNVRYKLENTGFRIDSNKFLDDKLSGPPKSMDHRSAESRSRGMKYSTTCHF